MDKFAIADLKRDYEVSDAFAAANDPQNSFVELSKILERLIRTAYPHVLIEVPLPVVQRMKLMRELHGPHPLNPAFIRFLALSLRSLRFKISLHIMHLYIPRELHPQADDDEPDMLINVMDAVLGPLAQHVDPFDFSKTVEELHLRYELNRWFVYENCCLLNNYIKHMDPDFRAIHQLPAGQWNAAFERYFISLVTNEHIDLDLKEAAIRNPNINIIRPLEVALKGGQYRAAIALISRRCDVNLIDIHDCHFMAGASIAFIFLSSVGFRFPSIAQLKESIRVPEEEQEYWNAFVQWLEVHKTTTETLANMCLEKIAKDRCDILRKLLDDYQFPPAFEQVKRKHDNEAVEEHVVKRTKRTNCFGTSYCR